ncbi:MAG: aminotransferase class III-fold pyridoxal phosphate-dependent enzyme [Trueperaceae bacterium]|nr:aminotransferase class III-fold pyridoxal phosphate-dependent enzyme [Trueperaceae bacterium]
MERAHGNGDLIRALEALGVAGPLRRLSPWELEDEKGRHLIHAGGYAALPFGEGPPALVDAAVRYLQGLDRVSFPQQTASDWRAALETNLVALLASVAPSHETSRVLFSNSGTEAVEAALKMARAARPASRWLLTFSGAFHGKTLGSLSVTPHKEYQQAFRPLLPHVRVLPYGDAEALEREIYALGADHVAAILVEPLQGEGGVVAPPAGFLDEVERMRQEHGVLVIADEVQTGLGRTGHWFASVAGGLDPDIVTLAKPLSGGLVPIGATVARSALVEAMLPGLSARRHSSTFAGNGLAMAVGLHALEHLVDGGFDARARRDGEAGLARLRAIAEDHPGLIRTVRGAGMLFAIELRNVLRPGLLGGRTDLGRLFASGLGLRTLHMGGIHACFSVTASGVVRLTPALDMPPHLQTELWDRLARVAERHPQAWRMAVSAGPGRLGRLAALAARGAPTAD